MSPNRMNPMSNVKFFLKELIINDTDTAFKTALFLVNFNQENKSLGSGTLDYNEIITQKGRYSSAFQEHQQGLISRENRDITIQNCRLLLLNWLDQLSLDFFKLPSEIEANLFQNNIKSDKISEEATAISQNSSFDFDIFLSFSSKNKVEAREVVEKLRGYGLRVFFSDESLKSGVGESYNTLISKALSNSNHFVWLCTPESAISSWVVVEHETFWSQIYINDKLNRRFFILKGTRFSENLVPILYRSLQFAEEPEHIINNLPIEIGKQPDKSSFYEVKKPEKIKNIDTPKQTTEKPLKETPVKSAQTLKEEEARIAELIRLEKVAKKEIENERKKAKELEIASKNEILNPPKSESEANDSSYILLKLIGGVIAFALFMTFCLVPIIEFIGAIFNSIFN
jgi:TIR domain